jgi:hypothetical protein
LITAILILAALQLLATFAIGGALLYSRRRKNEKADALVLAIERLRDDVNAARSEAPAPGPSLVGKTVVVNTRQPDDQTIRGVVYGHYADRITLRDAVYVTGVGEQAAPGLEHIPVGNVSAMQEITG